MGFIFFLGFIVLLIIAGIMVISVVTGIILIIIGNGKKKKQKQQNVCGKKETPIIMITIGIIMTVVPICIIGLLFALNKYTSIEQESEEKYSLVAAVNNNDFDLLKKLLEEGSPADSNDYNLFSNNVVSSRSYATPLWEACGAGKYDMAELLLEYGADSEREGPNRDTPFETALFNHHYDILELLLEKGADANHITYTGNTYLVSACRIRDVKAVEILLRHGADANIMDDEGVKLLDYEKIRYKNTSSAEEADCVIIIGLLKEYGAE